MEGGSFIRLGIVLTREAILSSNNINSETIAERGASA